MHCNHKGAVSMATVIFYEKPGCVNNTRQKALLAASGHEVVARNLLEARWTAPRLQRFFDGLPVRDWFNSSAPRIKSGEIDPVALSPQLALSEMVLDPLLIRRPLMQVGEQRRVGFDPEAVDAWIGLTTQPAGDLERCPRTASSARAVSVTAAS
jgi:nitrogenase-associated protein